MREVESGHDGIARERTEDLKRHVSRLESVINDLVSRVEALERRNREQDTIDAEASEYSE